MMLQFLILALFPVHEESLLLTPGPGVQTDMLRGKASDHHFHIPSRLPASTTCESLLVPAGSSRKQKPPWCQVVEEFMKMMTNKGVRGEGSII